MIKPTHYLIFLFSALYLNVISCQEQVGLSNFEGKNSVYIEFFGSSVAVYNISYDRIILQKKKSAFTAAMGVQWVPYSDEPHLLSFTPQINYLIGNKDHFELGIGSVITFTEGIVAFPLRIGYRFQKKESGFFFKIALTPTYFKNFFGESNVFLPWAGIAFGKSF